MHCLFPSSSHSKMYVCQRGGGQLTYLFGEMVENTVVVGLAILSRKRQFWTENWILKGVVVVVVMKSYKNCDIRNTASVTSPVLLEIHRYPYYD